MSISPTDEPRAQGLEFTSDALVVHLLDGRPISVPIEWYPKLRDASAEDRLDWRLIRRGVGIHWERLDEDLSVRGLLVPDQVPHQQTA